jgi:ubiquinone/menaquinone biosynthesis C-methylase UbiE
MQLALYIIAALAVFLLLLHFAWRYASRRWALPCPSLLSWMVDGSAVDRIAGTELTLSRMALQPGMTVVEMGPGPGRLLLRAARRVLPGGRAIGVELQDGMLNKLRAKLAQNDPGNVNLIHASATEKVLPDGQADVVYLCTVLGEIPDRRAALVNCLAALRPGGLLSITEIIGDPHYQRVQTVRELATSVGFEFEDISNTWRMYTANFRKSLSA